VRLILNILTGARRELGSAPILRSTIELMNYSLATLWHDRSRYIPAILAVTFSAVLIALQSGLLLGLFSITSIPVDRTRAHIWIGAPEVSTVDKGRPIPFSHLSRLATLPGVEMPELFYQAYATWTRPTGGSDVCAVIGSSLEPNNIGALSDLTPDLLTKLTEPMSVVVDSKELPNLGIKGVGDFAEINKQKVHVVGMVHNLKSMGGPCVLCSAATAKRLLAIVMPADHCSYMLAKVNPPEKAPEIVQFLRSRYTDMSSYTAAEFSIESRMHWLTKTRAGVAIGYTALLGLLVGMVITSQTLYAATTAQAREFAILLALGIPRWRISMTVLVQSFWIGIAGVIFSYPVLVALVAVAEAIDVKILLPVLLLGIVAAITLVMAIASGLFASRSVRNIEPMSLLR
jgi:putative ABC transport system permease protein